MVARKKDKTKEGLLEADKQSNNAQSANDTRQPLQCSQCGSSRISSSRLQGLDSLWVTVFSAKPYRCLSCHKRFWHIVPREALLKLVIAFVLLIGLIGLSAYQLTRYSNSLTSSNDVAVSTERYATSQADKLRTLDTQELSDNPQQLTRNEAKTAVQSTEIDPNDTTLGLSTDEILSLIESVGDVSELESESHQIDDKVAAKVVKPNLGSEPDSVGLASRGAKDETIKPSVNGGDKNAASAIGRRPVKSALDNKTTFDAKLASKSKWVTSRNANQRSDLGARSEKSFSEKGDNPPDTVAASASNVTTSQQTQAIRARVEQWRKAWSEGDIDAYLDAYSSSFEPAKGLSQAAWRAQRRARVTPTKNIQVAVSNVRVELAQDQQSARVSFHQNYRSNTYKSISRKQLSMVRVNGQWVIALETSI